MLSGAATDDGFFVTPGGGVIWAALEPVLHLIRPGREHLSGRCPGPSRNEGSGRWRMGFTELGLGIPVHPLPTFHHFCRGIVIIRAGGRVNRSLSE